jgi:DNA-binding NtrC family response regulator
MAHKYKLLVIDDEPEILETIKSYFEKRDFMVETALNGEDGLNKLRNESFDVALIDLVMPKLSGLEVIECINKELIPVNIAIITGHGGEKEAVAALNLGGIVHAWFYKEKMDLPLFYEQVKKLAHVISDDKLNAFFELFETHA